MVQIRVKDIKEGDIIREYEHGLMVEMTAMEDAHFVNEETKKGWTCKCWLDKDSLELFENPDYPAYRLNIYKV
jgi:hypothetical protein